MKISQIILGFFALVAIIFEGYLGIFSLVGFFIQVILMASVAGLFVYSISSSPTKTYKAIFLRSVLILMSLVGILVSIFSGFVTYHNLYPATLSDVTLSDESGTVIFVQMSHIASQGFFEDKNTQLQLLEKEGYTFLVEGVQGGTPDNHDKFDAYMGFRFTETLYDSLAAMTGLASQNNESLYAGIASGSLTSVDLSLDQVVELIGDAPPIVSGELPDIEKELSGALSTLSPRDQKLLNFTVRAFLNWSLKNSGDIEASLMEGEKAEVFRAIIEKRNDPIVEYIRTHPGDKIAVVYGALHFNGVYAGLQRLSPNWKIIKIDQTHPYR